jgi:hypothetical protein
LGKLSHANPAVVLHTIIDQLQSYDNMVQPVVDALKYVTTLSFDVLACKRCAKWADGRRVPALAAVSLMPVSRVFQMC